MAPINYPPNNIFTFGLKSKACLPKLINHNTESSIQSKTTCGKGLYGYIAHPIEDSNYSLRPSSDRKHILLLSSQPLKLCSASPPAYKKSIREKSISPSSFTSFWSAWTYSILPTNISWEPVTMVSTTVHSMLTGQSKRIRSEEHTSELQSRPHL